MKIVFLDAATMGSTPLLAIERLGEFVRYDNSTPEEALERIKDADVVLLNKVEVNKEFLDAAPKLKLICEAGTGMNNIDAGLCKERGIIVRNVAGYSTEAVAQHTWALILGLCNRLFLYDSFVKDGLYSKGSLHTDPAHPYTGLSGKSMGIIGMGAIGSKVAGIAEAFGMKVAYFSTSGTSHCHEYPSLTLDELLMGSDVVSIHAPLNERTSGLIGMKELQLMKRTALLINTSRGGIACESAIAQAVDEGLIAGAGLDAYEYEPLPQDSPLLRMRHPERVILTPHVAWANEETRLRLANEMARNIELGWS